MSLYAIGDVQGCFNALQRLLDMINFDPGEDELWFAGDLVNRGDQSLETLCFIKSLGDCATCVLGNHDLRLLRVDAGLEAPPKNGTLTPILESSERSSLIAWLRQRPVFKTDFERKLAMVHAGLLPSWTLQAAQKFTHELEVRLQADDYKNFLEVTNNMDINSQEEVTNKQQQLLFALNVMTHIRICNEQERIMFSFKQSPADIPKDFAAWFDWPHQREHDFTLIIGHWAALGFAQRNGVLALDTGCVWGRQLTAYCLDPGNEHRVSVEC